MADFSRWLRQAAFLLLAVALAALAARWWLHGRFFESTDDAYVRADTSAITARVGGEILDIAVADNQAVHKGDVLLHIDARDYAARVERAKAGLAAAAAAVLANAEQIRLQQANVAASAAALDAAEADEVQQQKEFQRAERLVRDGVATQQRLDAAQAAYRSARASVQRAEAQRAAARQQVAAAEVETQRLQSEVQAQRAALELAEIDFEATTVIAPIDGVVGDRAARVGARVAAGERLLSIVPLQAVYVTANFKETQLKRMQVGQPVAVKVDAYPGHVFHGRVDSLSPASGAEFSLLPPQNATGNFTKIVQRVPVRITLDTAALGDGHLRPGLSVVAEVDTRTPAATAAQAATDGAANGANGATNAAAHAAESAAAAPAAPGGVAARTPSVH